jgi:tRNA modification GTPase
MHAHGSPVILQALLEATFQCGAAPAHPGEFTRRAFEHGKIDLLQAEAIAAASQAVSREQAQAALFQLEGGWSLRLRALEGRLRITLVQLEAALDFPEEVDWQAEPLRETWEEALLEMDGLLAVEGSIGGGEVQPALAIAGRPNVGKSSLLNALLGYPRAIVSATPGTTRDTVEAEWRLGEGTIRLVDTAGLGSPANEPEELGMAQARSCLEKAVGILWLVDLSRPPVAEDQILVGKLPPARVLVLGNKIDVGEDPGWCSSPLSLAARISATEGTGLAELRDLIARYFPVPSPNRGLTLSPWQWKALLVSRETLLHACQGLEASAPELLAAQLKAVLETLGQVTGREAPPDLLEEIFSRFCLGK